MENGAHYYHLDSGGERTNLQLFALKEAKRTWDGLAKEVLEYGEDVENLKERCVLALANLGLSISQLLGQNNPAPEAWVPPPLEILRKFVRHHGLSSDLVVRFERFNYFYNGCRHFGKTTTGRGYKSVDELTFTVARECYEFGLEIWSIVIGVYGRQPDSDLEGFDIENVSEDW